MQDVLLKALVVALGLLTYPTDDPGVGEQRGGGGDAPRYEAGPLEEEEQRDLEMAPASDDARPPSGAVNPEKEEHGSDRQGRGEEPGRPEASEAQSKRAPNGTAQEAGADWAKDFLCFILNTFSVVSTVCFLGKCLTHASPMVRARAEALLLPDSATLQDFHARCVVASRTKWTEEEFLEGFANDLLESMRLVCGGGGAALGDFTVADGADLKVPLTLPRPFRFQCVLGNEQASQLLPDMQVCGRIEVVEEEEEEGAGSCPCRSSATGDDMVCLLHCDKAPAGAANVCDELCSKGFLSKSRVARWFRGAIRQAWEQIAHKYEVELSIRYVDAPGALAVRFRSGRVLRFRLNPVVKFDNNAHFYITPRSPRESDTLWTLSLSGYEDRLLRSLSARLPDEACHLQTLEIACFLHRRQTSLFRSDTVGDRHFRTALMHLLLDGPPSQWEASAVAQRLQDLMGFMARSLEKKLLHHVLIGNPAARKFVQLPAELTRAKPVNLFHPLVVHDCIYKNAAMHFKETLRNAHMLIQDYVD
ncbi:inositol 1,4,5-trisphosphate receptor-interacting protein [Betta splendens]|uniref:Inositol 1,4,5-trisphosphate receptor-interacting protein n=1 Tax=Betta splendens TaxID=158456 RepID=A0A6P7NGA6_BETSP|nr:inositol 1,4,5-trisphosphate receptor-interacting protein [Betta splendens]